MRNVHREHGIKDVEGIRINALFPDDGDLGAMAGQLPRNLRSGR